MARIKGSGDQHVQTIGVRANPKTIEDLKVLAEINGTSYSKEVRAALDSYLTENAGRLEEASRRIKKDVVVAADLGHLNKHVVASLTESLKVQTGG